MIPRYFFALVLVSAMASAQGPTPKEEDVAPPPDTTADDDDLP